MNFNLFIITLVMFIGIMNAEFERPSDCGKNLLSKKIFTRIVGGTDAKSSEFPFMSSLQKNENHFCGATILNKRWLLTAAHCLQDIETKDLSFIVGTVDNKILKINDKSLVYKAEKIIINGCYDGINNYFTHDIALIKSERVIVMEESDSGEPIISTVCLPKQNTEPHSRDVFVSDWGIDKTNSISREDLPSILQKANTTLYAEEYCRIYTLFKNIAAIGFWELGYKLCVKYQTNTICFGDSGGPLIEIRDGKAYQIGITSHTTGNIVISALYGIHCHKSDPIAYTKVSKYIDWIETNINKYENSNETKITTEC